MGLLDPSCHRAQGLRFALSFLLVFAAGCTPSAFAQRNSLPGPGEIAANEEHREKFQKVPEVLKALDVKEGSWVADVGAFWGFFTVRIAPVAGNTGRIFAVELQQDLLDLIRKRAQDAGLQNVEPILGQPDDPKLPAGKLDSVLIVNSYHEMEKHREMLAQILRALKPGGRLVMTEPSQERHRVRSREEQVKNHEIAPGIAEQEIREAGFEIIERTDPFLPPSKELEDFSGAGGWWMIVARRAVR